MVFSAQLGSQRQIQLKNISSLLSGAKSNPPDNFAQMIEQFQKILQTPRASQETYLRKAQDAMLNAMESLLPQEFDFTGLAHLFQQNGASGQMDRQCLASLTLELTEYFVNLIQTNFISLHSYFALEEQTQKLESTIRGHIKMEQEMKMYLQHLEYKVERYEHHFKRLGERSKQKIQSSQEFKEFKEKETLEYLKKRETQLLKQRLVLLRKVDHLERTVQDQVNQLRRLNSPTSATIQQIREGLTSKVNSEINQEMTFPWIARECQTVSGEEDNLVIPTQNQFQAQEKKKSTYSLHSDHQMTQKKSSIPQKMHELSISTGRQRQQPLLYQDSLLRVSPEKVQKRQGTRELLEQHLPVSSSPIAFLQGV